jgi:hypothetical protein
MREPGFIKRPPRVDTSYQGSLIDSDGNRVPATVTDISSDGCRLSTDAELKIGERIEIHVDKYGTYPAQIRWVLGRDAGALFLDPVRLKD